jgi:hypothetical protein
MQHQHEQVAMRSPEQRASFNHGQPGMGAMAHPGGQAMHEERGAAAEHGGRGGPHEGAPRGGEHRGNGRER